jgi:hypothetical protein
MDTLGTISLVLLIWTLVSIPLGMLAGSVLRFSSEVEMIRGPTQRVFAHQGRGRSIFAASVRRQRGRRVSQARWCGARLNNASIHQARPA